MSSLALKVKLWLDACKSADLEERDHETHPWPWPNDYRGDLAEARVTSHPVGSKLEMLEVRFYFGDGELLEVLQPQLVQSTSGWLDVTRPLNAPHHDNVIDCLRASIVTYNG